MSFKSWLELVISNHFGPLEVSSFRFGSNQRDAEEPNAGEYPAPDNRWAGRSKGWNPVPTKGFSLEINVKDFFTHIACTAFETIICSSERWKCETFLVLACHQQVLEGSINVFKLFHTQRSAVD